MTLSSQYLDDLSRVRLELSDLYPEPNGAVRIDRSANASMVPSDIVRGAVTLPLINPDGLSLTGDAGDYASTPDAAALDITGDIDLRADATLDSWASGSFQALAGKYDTSINERSYMLGLSDDGIVRLNWSTDGSSIEAADSTVTPTVGTGGRLALRVTLDADNGSGGWTVTFYTAPSIRGPWTQLGDPVDNSGGGTTSIHIGTADLTVGARNNDGSGSPVAGLIHAIEVYDGIDGSLVADPYFADEAAATSSFSDSSGNAWTVNGTAEIVEGVWARVDDYEFYADVENFYTATRVEPGPGLFLGGVSGDYASTPDDASLDITGDLDLRVEASVDEWDFVGAAQCFVAKYDTTGDNRSWIFFIHNGGHLRFQWSTDGASSSAMDASEPVGISTGRLAVRVVIDVDNGSGDAEAAFYTATSIAGPWTQVGNVIDLGSSFTFFSGDADVTIGLTAHGAFPLAGTIHAAEVRDGINGTEVANPDFAAEDSGATSFTDDAGRTWTLQGSSVIYGPTLDGANTTSITPDLEGITWLKSIKYPALNRPLGEAPDYRPVQRSSRTGVFNIKGRVPPIAVYDAWTSRWWTMEFVTNTLAEARDMDLVLAASRTLFIHVPRELENECFTNLVSGMPGGYVMAQNATMRHTVGGSHVMQWVLPVRQVAPPGPEISGGTLTWETIRRLYGSWTALWAAYSTWRELWETIMDPEDALSLQ